MSIFDVSGKFGLPTGPGRLTKEEDEVLDQLRNADPKIIREIIVDAPAGSTNWIRFSADGTKLAGHALTVSRTSLGTYLVTSPTAFPVSGGFFQYGVLVTPSTESGNGGDGVSAFNAFSDDTGVQSDQFSNGECYFWYVASTNKIYLLGPNTDEIWIHDLADWTGTPTKVSAGGDIVHPSSSSQSGCINAARTYIWISWEVGFTGTLRAFEIATNIVTDFGTTGTTTDRAVAAITSGGTEYVFLFDANDSSLKLYSANFGTPALTHVRTYTGIGNPLANRSTQACYDADGFVWFADQDKLIRLDPNGDAFSSYTYPTINASATTGECTPVYDSLRNRIYVSIALGSVGYNYVFSDWTTTNNSGTWERFGIQDGATYAIAMTFNDAADVLFFTDASGDAYRLTGGAGLVVDRVNYDADTSYFWDDNRHVAYVGTCGFVWAQNSGPTTWYLVRLCYNGSEIAIGGEGGFVGSILVPMYRIISATQANVYLFRSLSPIIRADGECSVHFLAS